MNLLKESLLYYSPNFRDILKELGNNQIANALREKEGQNFRNDITFVDIDSDCIVTFTQMSNAKKRIDNFLDTRTYIDTNFSESDGDFLYDLDINGQGPGIYKKSRNQIRLGKLVNYIAPNLFSATEIENFINLIKSIQKLDNTLFETVSGLDILDYYKSENYQKKNVGSLGNSCMNDHPEYLKLYTHNPETCSLIILKVANKIVGRALLWKLDTVFDEDGSSLNIEYFMDRAYSINEYYITKFRLYAKKNGFSYKENRSDRRHIIFNGRDNYVDLTVKVKKGDYKWYPYMDTFARLDTVSGNLYNDYYTHKSGYFLCGLYGKPSIKNYGIIKSFRNFFTSSIN